ncbi:hypothetical protein DCAR_0728214 [Daucus carota subsp. sativus]|uniref:Uncharacterized protein n=1 Tax=Daucus carota subsp. sativus TaxID=79200 RepID=A0A161ZJS5_DAUCS|nr:hypothetical protein DCAR_0728214 [Daucus carota subsp. sativus]
MRMHTQSHIIKMSVASCLKLLLIFGVMLLFIAPSLAIRPVTYPALKPGPVVIPRAPPGVPSRYHPPPASPTENTGN